MGTQVFLRQTLIANRAVETDNESSGHCASRTSAAISVDNYLEII